MANVDGVMSILSSDFAKAGVELKLQPVDAATFSANVTQGHKYDISYSSWGTIDDVDTTLLTIFGIGQTLNFMEFNSQEQEDLLNAMQSETDYSKRLELRTNGRRGLWRTCPAATCSCPTTPMPLTPPTSPAGTCPPAIARSWPAPTLSTSMRNKAPLLIRM